MRVENGLEYSNQKLTELATKFNVNRAYPTWQAASPPPYIEHYSGTGRREWLNQKAIETIEEVQHHPT
jgi:hypothetical protein